MCSVIAFRVKLHTKYSLIQTLYCLDRRVWRTRSYYESGGHLLKLPVMRLREAYSIIQAAKEGAVKIQLDGKEASLLALTGTEAGVRINLAFLQGAERTPLCPVCVPDELVSSADAEDWRRCSADDGEQSFKCLKLILLPVGGVTAQHYCSRRYLLEAARGDFAKVHHRARFPGRCCDTVACYFQFGVVNRTTHWIVENLLMLAVDVQDGHWTTQVGGG